MLPIVDLSEEVPGEISDSVRRTLTLDVAAGQYEVRLRKTTANSTNLRLSNTVDWAVLKSYQADTGTADCAIVCGGASANSSTSKAAAISSHRACRIGG